MKTNNTYKTQTSLFCLTRLLALVIFLAGSPKAFTATITTPATNAGTGADVAGVGTVTWSNPGNIISNDNTYATVAVNGGSISHYLQATNYGFGIPAGATITGITVTIGRFENSTALGNDVRDYRLQLIKGGVIVGSNLAATGTDWPITEGVASYGGTGNMWGTTWTPADINASNFGVALAVNSTNIRIASVDYMQISVTYTATYRSQFTAMNIGSPTWCAGETRTVTVTVKNIGTATWTDGAPFPDVNIGVKWNAEIDYFVRTDAGGLAAGSTQTYSLTVTAPSAGSNNLTFDIVKEGDCWFGNNSGSCGPGNSVYSSSAITIIGGIPAQPSAINGSATPCVGSSQTYNVTNITGVTYNWTFPSGWTQTGGGTTNSVTATVGLTPGDITVTPSNACGNGATRNLGVTPNALATPSVSITSAPGNTICAGISVTFTATPTNGGTLPSYQWKLNGGNVGLNSPTYTNAALVNGNQVSCVMTSNIICASPNPVASNTITMAVNPLPTATASNNGPVCIGKTLSLTGGPGSMAIYSWSGPSSYTSSTQSPTVSLSTTLAMAGTYTITVTNTNGCTSTASTAVIVNDCTPTIIASPTSLTAFTYIEGYGPSAFQSFNLSGAYLTGYPGTILVTAPTDYVVCLTSGGTYGNSVSVPYSSATLPATPIYVKLKVGLPFGNYNNENITNAGGGAATVNVACSGSVSHFLCKYRSKATGNWTDYANSWQVSYDGVVWANVTILNSLSPYYPINSNSCSVEICNGHSITIDASIPIDDMIIDAGGILNINNNTLTVADGSGDDLTNNGTINNGQFQIFGTTQMTNNGTISNNGTIINGIITVLFGTTQITNNGTINNNGTIINGIINALYGTTLLTNNSTINNNGTIINGQLFNINGVTQITNNRTINNNGITQIINGELRNNNTYNEGFRTYIGYTGSSSLATITNNSGATFAILPAGQLYLGYANTTGTFTNNSGGTLTNSCISSSPAQGIYISNSLSSITNNGMVNDNGTIFNNGIFTNNATFDYYMTSGSITGSNNFIYGSNGILIYHGSIAQTTSNYEFPPGGVPYLIVNNSHTNGATLNANKSVINTLTLTNGPINLNGKTLTIQNSATTAITRISGYIKSGALDQDFSSKVQWNIGSTIGNHVFPIGLDALTHIPFVFNLTSGDAGNVAISTYPAGNSTSDAMTVYVNRPTIVDQLDGYGHSGIPGNAENIVKRFWKIEPTKQGVANITFTYPEEEIPVTGEEVNGMVAQRYDSTLNRWENPLSNQNGDTETNKVTVNGVTSFSPWAISKKQDPLPVELLSFSAICYEGIATILWSTASETNNDFFTLQRSIDAREWETLDNIQGAGNSNVVTSYSYTDLSPYANTTYYRLKQTDFDGTQTESMTVWVKCIENDPNSFAFYNVTNDYNGNVNVVFTYPKTGENYALTIFDITGRSLMQKKGETVTGLNQTDISLKDIPYGVYLITISDAEKVISKKILNK
jgi:hypothetical protein